jgi:cyanophycinase
MAVKEKKTKKATKEKKAGTLIIIGGHEKDGDQKILKTVADRVGSGKLVICTVATVEPEESFAEYRKIFQDLGIKKIEQLDIRIREEGYAEEIVSILDGATVVFFTGGDQLKITSQLGDSRVYQRIQEIFESGGTIAGTSAGASVMSETMLVSGSSEESHRIGSALGMAPGLGLIHDVVIDQHFAERGRLSRLLAAITQNPRTLGIGIDEDTAILVTDGDRFEVIGDGAVTVLDGSKISYSNLAEDKEEMDRTLSVFDVKLHMLSDGNQFDLRDRRPGMPPKPEEQAEEKTGEREKIEVGVR